MSAAPWITERAAAIPTAKRNNGKTKGTVSTAPRVTFLRRAIAHAVGFAIVTGAFYGFFALMGHSLHSSAMKQRQNAELRTEGAQQDVLELNRQVSGMLSADFIDQWAKTHGFVKVGKRGEVYVSAEQPSQG
jgi:hypothetical protein